MKMIYIYQCHLKENKMTNNDASLFFVKNTNYKKEDIKSIKEIHHGFTNKSFFLITKDNLKWQIRFSGLNEIVDRKNELKILKLIGDENIIYYDETGNFIKKWIDGRILSLFFNKKKKLKLICEKINQLHSTNITDNNEILIHDYFEYINEDKNLDHKIKDTYISLVNKYSNQKKVLSHNDLSRKNIIYNSNEIIFIDFEWSRINNNYFDVANFIRENNISNKWINFIQKNIENIDINILKDFIFITTCFAYQWTFVAKNDKKTINYRKKCLKKINSIYKSNKYF
ncbi:MAG: phosphotransferase [Mycoplasmoidaceae bacterium]